MDRSAFPRPPARPSLPLPALAVVLLALAWALSIGPSTVASGAPGAEPPPPALEGLPEPPWSAGPRAEPLPLVGPDGELAGLAWLEGDDPARLEVRFAAWNGTSWGPAETVAGPGPGSQMALAATVLADGSPLLLWSAFDGEDDEVLWSLGGGGSWSEPRRLGADDRVPDITPAVRRDHRGGRGTGALAAWSEYAATGAAADPGGGYRVMVSRLEVRGSEATWSPPRPIGPPGSLFPTWTTPEGGESAGPLLLLRTVRPRGWQAVELGPGDLPRRRAQLSLEVTQGTATLSGPARADRADDETSPAVSAEERVRLLSPAHPPSLEIRSEGVRFAWPATEGEGAEGHRSRRTAFTRTIPWQVSP